jgi:hypothetical protein
MAKRYRLNEAARLLGRKGGLKGGKATAANRTAEERREAASKAAKARWAATKRKSGASKA